MRALLKIFLTVGLLFGVSFAKELNFVFITDINLDKKNAYKLQRTIKEINSNRKIDFVVFGGNNLKKANIENLNYFTYLLKRVHKKSYVLLGATDVSTSVGLDKEYYLKRVKAARFFNHPNTPNYVFKKGNNVFIAMDGSKQFFPQANGCYTKQELIWLKKQLEKYKNKNIIILQHFPLVETSSKWLETAKIDEYLYVLEDYKNVKLIVSGNYEVNQEIKTGDILNILTENYSKQGAYRIITLDLDNDFIGSYLVK